MTICLAAVATTKYIFSYLPPRCGDLQVVFTNYLVCKTLSANIDFGNLYAAKNPTKKNQEKEQSLRDNVAAAAARRIRRRRQGKRQLKIRSILFGARARASAAITSRTRDDVIKAALHWYA